MIRVSLNTPSGFLSAAAPCRIWSVCVCGWLCLWLEVNKQTAFLSKTGKNLNKAVCLCQNWVWTGRNPWTPPDGTFTLPWKPNNKPIICLNDWRDAENSEANKQNKHFKELRAAQWDVMELHMWQLLPPWSTSPELTEDRFVCLAAWFVLIFIVLEFLLDKINLTKKG